ncbi:MAG: hypothetical protein KC478_11450 [Bacteriovoracaceae bacterium]|nr:hypothetical protein [Bacteriovoracaceae bacterium]
MCKYLFILMIWASHLVATTFAPMSIKEQILSSQGVVQGEVVAINTVEDSDYGIVTKVFLRADRWMGPKVSNGHLELFFPGGEFGDEGRLVAGAPKFEVGEKVVVFTTKHNEKNWVYNLGLGKFSLKKVGQNQIMVNQVFPQVPNVGQMPLDKFLRLATRLKGKKLKERFKDKYERTVEKQAKIAPLSKRSRSLASVSDAGPNVAEKTNPMWLVFLFGLLGIAVRLSGRRNNK